MARLIYLLVPSGFIYSLRANGPLLTDHAFITSGQYIPDYFCFKLYVSYANKRVFLAIFMFYTFTANSTEVDILPYVCV